MILWFSWASYAYSEAAHSFCQQIDRSVSRIYIFEKKILVWHIYQFKNKELFFDYLVAALIVGRLGVLDYPRLTINNIRQSHIPSIGN